MGGCNVPGKSRGMPRECMGVSAKCQGNGGNPKRMYGSGYKLPGECMGMGVGAKCPGDAGECRGMQRNAR